MAALSNRIRDWIANLLAAATVKQIVAGVVAALCVAGGIAWTWIWHHVNPQFVYEATPSSNPSHFLGMGQILSQIDKDSQLYCAGGWDQRIAKIGLRSCNRFRFEPPQTYRMTVCTHDERSISVTTSDQLIALQHFENAFKPRECFTLAKQGTDDYVVGLGKDAQFVELQFANDAPQKTAFCGCTGPEIAEVSLSSGAKLK